jgi:folate-binding protein YgfZ
MDRLISINNRSVLAISGEDRFTFLQGLITNDIHLLQKQKAIYAAFLSPQGRFIHDFFITEKGDTLRLEVERERCADLIKRLKIYKLRSKITIEDQAETWQMAVFLGSIEELPAEWRAYAYQDPRLPALGIRLILPLSFQITELCPFDVYDQRRITLGVPDGSRDMVPEKAIPLEYRLDALHAISWTKGCYIGQELTARTKHLGVVRKGLFPAIFEGAPPVFGTPVYTADGTKAGTILSSCGDKVLCRLRIELFQEGDVLTYEGGSLQPFLPKWKSI